MLVAKHNEEWARYGREPFTFPLTEIQCCFVSGIGPALRAELIAHGLMNPNPPIYAGLSNRAASCLNWARIRSKAEAEAAIKSRKLWPGRVRNYGWRTHCEVETWCTGKPATYGRPQ